MDARVTSQTTYGRRPLLICFSHLRWNFVYQRPQHLLSRAAQHYAVAFMEEPLREPVPAPLLRRELSKENVVVLTPILPQGYDEAQALAAQRELLDAFIEAERPGPLVLWYYTPAALAFSSGLACDAIVYDCMDELSAFKAAPPSLRVYERALFKIADVVFTGGHSLHEAKKHQHHNIHAFPSSIDAKHFGKARLAPPCPEDVAHLNGPRLGFFGVVDERMDLTLIAGMAQARPHWNFVMIGPVVKIDPQSLPRLHNLHWIGGRDYSVLPDYIASWDVGVMPFALNESTRFISPTKTPEFLAAGCQVVSTAIADVVNPYGDHGLVEIASSVDEAVASAERLMNQDKQSWLGAVDAHLAGNSWDRTWSRMNAHIRACLPTSRRMQVSRETIGEARV